MDATITKIFPACFASREHYELWLDTNEEELTAAHCTDCLPSFKVQMVRCGRCEHAETTFKFAPADGFTAEDGETLVVIGTWKQRQTYQARETIEKMQAEAPVMVKKRRGKNKSGPVTITLISGPEFDKAKTRYENRYSEAK